MNFSDRFLAKNCGTGVGGTDPHSCGESLRHDGVVFQSRWDVTPDIDTFEKFYSDIPQAIKAYALQDFIEPYIFYHEWVYSGYTGFQNKISLMKNALKLSPLGISVTAWQQDDDGYYYWQNEEPNNHWVMCYGYEDGRYWKIFDSYDNTHKKIAWNSNFNFCKRYHISKVEVKKNSNWLVDIVKNLWEFFKFFVYD